MDVFIFLISIYCYIHYGAVALIASIGVYDNRRKILVKDLIPFMWVYTTYRYVFEKNSD